MATYIDMWSRSKGTTLTAQIAVAIVTDAKYKLQNSTDPDEIAWAGWVAPNAYTEATKWQLAVCLDPAIADTPEPTDAQVQAAVIVVIPAMVNTYKVGAAAPLRF
jgi:hypothetical protein